eukprot:2448160-Prymnesium_polylepis.1
MNATLSAILGVPDAFDSSPRCGVTTLLPVDPGASVESAAGFATVVAQVTLVWCVLWYASVLFARLWLLKWLPRSSVESENGSFFVGQKFPAMLKVILVSGMANACLWGFQDKSLEQNFLGGPAIEIAGLLFTTFEIADLVLATGHRLMDWEYVVHHLLHIVLGLIIRGNCMTGLLAAVLMAQARAHTRRTARAARALCRLVLPLPLPPDASPPRWPSVHGRPHRLSRPGNRGGPRPGPIAFLPPTVGATARVWRAADARNVHHGRAQSPPRPTGSRGRCAQE